MTASSKLCRKTILENHPDFAPTFDSIRDILNGSRPFLPRGIRETLEALDEFEDQPDGAYYTGQDGNESAVQELAYGLPELVDIVHCSNQSQELGRAEPS